MIDLAALVLFPALMAYSAWSDLFTMRIANWISASLVAIFLLLACVCGLPWSTIVISHLSCGGAVLVLTFTLFAFGWIGGGDAKLAAATAVWIGWPHVLDYGVLSSLLGGALTVGILLFRKEALPSWAHTSWIARLHDKDVGVPYGIALACAGLFFYTDTSVWRAVVSA